MPGNNCSFKNNMIKNLSINGFLLSPDELKQAWLKVEEPEMIFSRKDLSIPSTVVATKGLKIPKILNSLDDLFKTQSFAHFIEISTGKNKNDKQFQVSEVSPYQKILTLGTVAILEGLKGHPVNKNSINGIEEAFKKQGLEDFLQITYHKILLGLSTARFQKNNLISYVNAIEEIHQQVQNILAILSIENGYEKNAFGNRAAQRLTECILPQELGTPYVGLVPSAMHGLSSTLSAVEKMKNSPNLNVAILKDSYYEDLETIYRCKKYDITILDGDLSDKNDLVFNEKSKKPFDLLFVNFITISRLRETNIAVKKFSNRFSQCINNNYCLIAAQF